MSAIIRSSASRFACAARTTSTIRSFSVVSRTMAEGDAAAGGDAFSKRERASEDLYIRKQLQEKLEKAKKKAADSQAELEAAQKEFDSGKDSK